MDESNTLSDAEMRLVAVNGSTIMLEGDFENMNMTNELLNEMLMVNNSKVDINDEYNVQLNGNPCVNSVKEINEEPTKLEISFQGINGLETIQIGVEEAKALGLYFGGVKNEGVNSWENCTLSGVEDHGVKDDGEKDDVEMESNKVKIHSVPVVSVSCLDREQETIVSVNEVSKYDNAADASEAFPFGASSKVDRIIKPVQDNNPDSLPAIGHLEGFQIPTSEDGVLLPATVNARMADGSYQTITLIPQVVNGAVTYTVHFSSLGREPVEKDLSSSLNYKDHYSEPLCNGGNISSKEIMNNEINSVEEFLHSVQSIKNDQRKNTFPGIVQKLSDNKTLVSGIINPQLEESVLKMNKSTDFTAGDLSVNYVVGNQLPIETKIDNLISENENVISKCKKVKYGKKLKAADSEGSVPVMSKMSKSNITKAKKVKFKNRGLKFPNESEQKKLKLSLLKPTKESLRRKGVESGKGMSPMPHMNLNGRLEYPNLKAIEETASPLSYLKVKTSQATKQPYFNVLPYPKDKTIPVQKQILPLNCDLQQAKNFISLQKFLETQKYQLKIQPIASNGNKIINIRPKPTLSEEVKVLNPGVNSSKQKEMQSLEELVGDKCQEDETGKKAFQENAKDVLLSDGKLNCLKFLKSPGSEVCTEGEKESNSEKLNGIFIKNNPEYFSQKFKDGKADEHPLGSSENPIQLVQTGHTFHSRQPLSEAQLRQIASILQKQKFDSPNVKRNSIFDPKTNTRIVYRVVYPEDVELKDGERTSVEGITKRKRGRHKTKFGGTDDEIQKKPSPLPRGPGRPKKTPVSTLEEDVIEEEIEDTTPKKKIPRTRSGRLSRPPRYMVKDYKRLHNSEASEKTSNSNYHSDEAYAAYQNGKKVPLERTDKIPDLELETNLLPGLRPQQRSKRNFKPEYRCPTCQKIYLGHTRMMWHLNKFPDHCNVEKYKENYYRKRTETKVRRAARRLNLCDVTNKVKQVLNSMPKDELTSLCGPILAEALTIWDFLLLRVNLLKGSRKDEVDALLHELVILLEKLTKIAEDIFLPVFTKEAEKDEDCVEIDRMEVAIALGLPVGFYKVNNDNLSLLRLPLTSPAGSKEPEEREKENGGKPEAGNLFPEKPMDEGKEQLFDEKSDPWDEEKASKKLEEDSFWLEGKVEDADGWHPPEDSSMKTLSTKFEPNLSTKILESSNDSIDDGKYEEPVRLLDLDSNSKDVDQSNSSGNMEGSPENHPKMEMGEKAQERGAETKDPSGLWNENSSDKVSAEMWHENSDMVQGKSAELWTNENSEMAAAGEKVDETNSEFLDSLLSVRESEGFLARSMPLMSEKKEEDEAGGQTKEKGEWRSDGEHANFIGGWETGKNAAWPKEESILSGSLQERMPGARTATRLTSTPETNANIAFAIPNRRNSISDFTNLGLEPGNLDVVLPPAKTLIKDCLKDDGGKFEMKGNVGESFDNFKVKNWGGDGGKPDLNVNSEELMKMALESLASQHDVINVPSSSFDSAMGILNQSQESGNLNLFAASDADALDFNLPLPEHLLRSNFSSANFQTTCASHFPTSSESPAFLSTATNNIFATTCTNSIEFETNYPGKKSKSLDDVMEFFETKTPFNGYDECNPFAPEASHGEEYPAEGALNGERPKKKGKVRAKKQKSSKGCKAGKKTKGKKAPVDYPKSNTIESIINEALFDSCAANSKSLQIEDSSPNGNSAIANGRDAYSLPIIPESLDEVENLDFLNQD